MLSTGQPTRSRNSRAEDLHVAGEHDEVDLTGDELKPASLGLRLRLTRDRHVVVRDAERLDLVAVQLVVGDDADDVHLELAATVAPEQIKQAVILT